MEQPIHFVRGPIAPQQNTRRIVALAVVGLLHVGMIYALAAGLAQQIFQKLPEEIKVAVEQPKIEKVPPPPPPDLAKPPPPFVPPPEIQIQTEAPATTAITTQNKVATPPPKPANTSLTARGRTHTLPPYPEDALRLQQQGTTKLRVTIDTDGNATDAVVIGSSGSDRLDQAAVDYVKSHWRWNPPMVNGQVSSVSTEVDIVWNLKNAR